MGASPAAAAAPPPLHPKQRAASGQTLHGALNFFAKLNGCLFYRRRPKASADLLKQIPLIQGMGRGYTLQGLPANRRLAIAQHGPPLGVLGSV